MGDGAILIFIRSYQRIAYQVQSTVTVDERAGVVGESTNPTFKEDFVKIK